MSEKSGFLNQRSLTPLGKTIVRSIYWLLCCVVLISCAEKKGDKTSAMDSSKEQNIDILKYKVKEDIYREDPLDISFNKILLERRAQDTYDLKIDAEIGVFNTNEIDKHYFILSIYPYDKDIHILDEDRRKFGFDMFSMDINYSNEGLIIGREIHTKIKRARAITLTLMEYKPKRKVKEIVMLNVKLK